MEPRRERKGTEKKKDDILKAVMMKLFLKKGYEATSMDDVCAVTKLTKPAIYHYFGSKSGLLYAVHMRAIEKIFIPYLDKASSVEDPEARLRMMIKEFTVIICQRPELRFLVHQSMDIRVKFYREIKKAWKRQYLLLRDTIAELKSKGKIREHHKPSWTALLLLGMITWMTYWFDYKRKDQIDEIADLVADLAFNGFSADAAFGYGTTIVPDEQAYSADHTVVREEEPAERVEHERSCVRAPSTRPVVGRRPLSLRRNRPKKGRLSSRMVTIRIDREDALALLRARRERGEPPPHILG